MEKFRFLTWKVYSDAQNLFSHVLGVVKSLPKEYRYELGSQLVRSSFSIVLNIAEGSGKTTDKELNRYFDIALGSLYETLASLDALKRNSLVDEKEFQYFYEKISDISNQLGGFKRKLKK